MPARSGAGRAGISSFSCVICLGLTPLRLHLERERKSRLGLLCGPAVITLHRARTLILNPTTHAVQSIFVTSSRALGGNRARMRNCHLAYVAQSR